MVKVIFRTPQKIIQHNREQECLFAICQEVYFSCDAVIMDFGDIEHYAVLINKVHKIVSE